ncbi:IclR family transcriptional regulator [Pseudoclavibacter endophyticus]|uniref:IclR family transcriptional regulator n=1 Tax=Pseudoclavibacter endophyticus TaxID=1778590 RepID=A0A6H9WPP8_9MICO|nr:IclR family transcriptional regulator [Pseudoclavibacter endophyticus]KAB1648805.1 IclR family transcriptional regulator [Pseudoclavibacter endophyticus]GGA68374.1 IclR family transcriptional regulator [Pseudoclavibacter endophyticus]
MPDTTPKPARRNASGLARDVELLDVLGSPESLRADGLGVVRVAELTGRDKAVVSRSLATLAEAGFVERDPATQAYRLGARIYALAAHTREARLTSAASPTLRRIARETRETASLNVLRGGHVLTVMSELSPHEFRATGWEGVTTSAWRTPSGRALLSDWDEISLRAWFEEHAAESPVIGRAHAGLLSSPFAVIDEPPTGPDQVRDYESLVAEITRIRERRYALSVEELERGIVAASTPISDFSGAVVAAINVSAPISRLGSDATRLGVYIARVGAELSAALGAP